MNNFINYTLYSSIIIFLLGCFLFIQKPNFLNYIVIIVGITSIINHYYNYESPEYSINKWPLYRICDWIFVILLILIIFLYYKSHYNFYYFSTLIIFIFIFIIWENILDFNLQKINICHAIGHLLLIFYLFYMFLIIDY